MIANNLMKTCAHCHQHLPRERFNRCSSRGSDGWQAYCRQCQHDHNHHYHRDGLRDARPNKHYDHRFPGWSKARLERTATAQGGCPLCGCTAGTWVLDHDRRCCPGRKSCGRCIRGVLCDACNRWLGHFERGRERRDAEWNWRALDYATAPR